MARGCELYDLVKTQGHLVNIGNNLALSHNYYIIIIIKVSGILVVMMYMYCAIDSYRIRTLHTLCPKALKSLSASCRASNSLATSGQCEFTRHNILVIIIINVCK